MGETTCFFESMTFLLALKSEHYINLITSYFRASKLEESLFVFRGPSRFACHCKQLPVHRNGDSVQSRKKRNSQNATRTEHINKTQKFHHCEGNVRVNAPNLLTFRAQLYIFTHPFSLLRNKLLSLPEINSIPYSRFIMNLKLFTVMGISWVLEIISTFSTNETVEGLLDLYNIFIGVFIFLIFVFKRRVLYELKCRFGESSDTSSQMYALEHFLKIFMTGLESRNAETATPRSTTITHTGNISMKDMAGTSDKGLPLLTASNKTPQIPNSG